MSYEFSLLLSSSSCIFLWRWSVGPVHFLYAFVFFFFSFLSCALVSLHFYSTLFNNNFSPFYLSVSHTPLALATGTAAKRTGCGKIIRIKYCMCDCSARTIGSCFLSFHFVSIFRSSNLPFPIPNNSALANTIFLGFLPFYFLFCQRSRARVLQQREHATPYWIIPSGKKKSPLLAPNGMENKNENNNNNV